MLGKKLMSDVIEIKVCKEEVSIFINQYFTVET